MLAFSQARSDGRGADQGWAGMALVCWTQHRAVGMRGAVVLVLTGTGHELCGRWGLRFRLVSQTATGQRVERRVVSGVVLAESGRPRMSFVVSRRAIYYSMLLM